MSINKFRTQATCVAALLLALTATGAMALPSINLTGATYNDVGVAGINTVTGTVGDSVTTDLGTVIFARDSTQPSGTGVFNPFLRLDCKGNGCDEQGYNTNGVKGDASNGYTTRKILDNMSPVNWTHDVLISSLQLDSTGNYYQFKLDINEPGNGMSLLSLDGLKLYSTSEPGQFGQSVDSKKNWDGPNPLTSNLLWNLDGLPIVNPGAPGGQQSTDRSILLDARVAGGPGSGVADMVMLVSKSVIDKAAITNPGQKNFILWSRFGLEQGAKADSSAADAGFEEWSYSSNKSGPGSCTNCPGTSVPAPGSAYLALLALGILGYQRRGHGTTKQAI
jgi:hypothetical protein